MKTMPIKLLLLAGLGGTLISSTVQAAPTEKQFRTEVVFFERENFTDVRDGNLGTEKGRDNILELLKTYLQERAQAYVPEGSTLSVTIKDVDLAGDFEPWRGLAAHDVRIVKEIYVPRIKLAFRLTDANGEVVKQGNRDLRDLNFMMGSLGTFNEPYRYEKAMIDNWLRSEFERVKTS
jgi:hypothetical protein